MNKQNKERLAKQEKEVNKELRELQNRAVVSKFRKWKSFVNEFSRAIERDFEMFELSGEQRKECIQILKNSAKRQRKLARQLEK